MRFRGQHAIVTGGSSGIGKATAIELARAGANVSIIARNQEKLDLARRQILAAVSPSQQVRVYSADVTHAQKVDRAMAAAIDELGPPELLLTAAGVAAADYFLNLPLPVFENTMATNYFGTLYAIRSAVPYMTARGEGHIVLVSSGAGLMGLFGYTAYSPSKFAVRGLAEALRCELKPHGIKVSVVYPPDTRTPQLEQENLTKPPETKAITKTARVWTAEQVAKKIVSGVRRNSFSITPGLAITLLDRLPLKPLLNAYFDRIVRRTQGAREQSPDG